MKKSMIRLLTILLSVLMLSGMFTVLSVLPASAADDDEEPVDITTIDYVKQEFKTPEEKLAFMGEPYFVSTDGSYEMYVNTFTGEVAVRDTASGQILFTNPYDVSGSIGSVSTKQAILSQVIIRYTDNDTQKFMYSYKDAALNNQITTRKIKNGVRVEYVIGDMAQRKLVPRLITKARFDTLIKATLDELRGVTLTDFYYGKFLVYFPEKNIFDGSIRSKQAIASLIKKYPIAEKEPIYVFDTTATAVELNFCEEIIKTYVPTYTFDMMDEDHEITGYVSDNDKSPVFKMSLEYTLTDNGLSVRFPTNGIRFDSSAYAIEYISILPYMGAGHSANTGYTFYPDGSGTLFRFEELNTKTTTTISRKVFGTDYAYHEISGTYQKTVRYPVYGVVENSEFLSASYPDKDNLTINENVSITMKDRAKIVEEAAAVAPSNVEDPLTEKDIQSTITSRGYVAVIEDGESLAEIATYHAGSLSDYNTIMTYFNPRPKDSYDISDSISVTTSSKWTVVSNRKYTGDYRIRYIMLTDENIAKENRLALYYPATWLGMAHAYRDYLIRQGVLRRIRVTDVTEDIPLYIQTFGALQVTEQILSFPVKVKKPLTTFGDIVTIYEDLSAAGIKNVNFKMVGYANGGMYATVPYKLKWEKAVSDKYKFQDLVEYAKDVNAKDANANLGLYPDFDFLYVHSQKAFDGLSLKRDAIKTIDNRYTSKRFYLATMQKYVSYFELALAPNMLSRFTEKLISNYLKYNPTGISVGTMGTDLNSDFDEDDPHNREDNLDYTVEGLKYISENVPSVMVDGGNSYTWRYVDHIVDAYLDSSRYVKSSNAVPFLGVVLHGFIQFAGSPMNMEGNTSYSILKTIENGAGVYFILSYQNTEKLKASTSLSKYYSIRYDIWKDDVISLYNMVNTALKDVQTKLIIDHEFLSGLRVLDVNELMADIADELKEAELKEQEYDEWVKYEDIRKVGSARAYAKAAAENMQTLLEDLDQLLKDTRKNNNNVDTAIENVSTALTAYRKALDAAGGDETKSTVKVRWRSYLSRVEQLKSMLTDAVLGAESAAEYKEKGQEILDNLAEGLELLKEAEGGVTQMVLDMESTVTEAQMLFSMGYKGIMFDPLIEEAQELAVTIPNKVVTKYVDEIGNPIWSAEDVEEMIAEARAKKDKQNQTEEEEEEETSKYLSNNGNIVAVTYGGKNGADNVPYKTFILNYNSYSVQVTYDGVDYVVPAGEFVTIMR